MYNHYKTVVMQIVFVKKQKDKIINEKTKYKLDIQLFRKIDGKVNLNRRIIPFIILDRTVELEDLEQAL